MTVVLVVEDEKIVALDIKKRLQNLGYIVPTLVASGEEAVRQAAETRADLVLMDIHLKGDMDGVTAAEQIRTQHNIPIIYLTAYSDEATLQRATMTEPFGYLLKPFEEKTLQTTIETALYRYRLERKLTAIHQLGQELTLLHEEEIIIRRVLAAATDVLQFEWAGGGLLEEVTGELIYYHYSVDRGPKLAALRLPVDDERNIGVVVIRSGRAVSVTDINRDARYISLAMGWAGRSELCVPMKIGQHVVGILNVASKHPHHFTLVDQQLLQTLADQAAVVLQNARLHREARRQTRELVMLNKTTRMLTSSLDLDRVLEQVLVEIRTLLEVEGATVLLYQPDSEELIFAAAASPAAEALVGMRMPSKAGLAGEAARRGRSILVADAQHDPRFYDEIDRASGMFTRSLLAVPMVINRQLVGVIECINKSNGTFSQRDLDTVETLASSAAIAIENARLYQKEREQFRRLQEAQPKLIQMEKMIALGRLVASIAHEINNPIQAVQNAFSLIKEEINGRQRREKLSFYLNITEEEIERIATIVRRMRDFYHLSHRRQLLDPGSDAVDDFYRLTADDMQAVDLAFLMGNVLGLVNKQFRQNRVEVEYIQADDVPALLGSADHLKQVFLNLALNALDAMGDRGGKLRVSVRLEETDGLELQPQPTVRIEFSDTGPGISPEVLSQLFEPFVTTKEWGAGFGLFTCYKIIEAHQGQITVESQPDTGTTFIIKLPLSPATAERSDYGLDSQDSNCG